MGTEGELKGNQEGTTGQAQEDQGQPKPQSNQPVEVELADGTRVSLEELKQGYMKDADYRKKTEAVAEERRRLQAERDAARQQPYIPRSQANLESETAEELEPVDVLMREVVGLKTLYARDLLTREIDRLAAQYPDADKRTVFAACWSNPNANIENEMVRSQETILAKIAEKTPKAQVPATLEEFLKLNPKAKEEYDRKVQEDFMRKKAQKSDSTKTVVSGGSGSAETFREDEKKPANYREVSERLKAKLKEEGDESF